MRRPAPPVRRDDARDASAESGDFVQVSRLGNPLVNEAVVPAQLKDYFNRSHARRQDPVLLGEVQDPEVPGLVEGVYKVPNPNKLPNAAAAKRNDLSAIFLTGFSKKVFAGTTFGGIGKGVARRRPQLARPQRGQPEPGPCRVPAPQRQRSRRPPTTDPKFSRLGALGGDLAGYPNGRRLQRRHHRRDAARRRGRPHRSGPGRRSTSSARSTASTATTARSCREFPYIADPHSGSDPRVGQTPVTFQQNFTSNGGQVTTQRQPHHARRRPAASCSCTASTPTAARPASARMTLDKTGTTSVTKVFPATPRHQAHAELPRLPRRAAARRR